MNLIFNILLQSWNILLESSVFILFGLLISGLLRRLKNQLTDGQRLLVLHIPRGESFIRAEPFHQEMSSRLRSIYRRLGLPVVDVETLFSASTNRTEVPKRYYRVRANGSIGHLNPVGHVSIARALTEAILNQPAGLPLAFARQNSMIPSAR